MKKQIPVLLLIILAALSLPLMAKTAGLVPCGGANEKECTACDLVVLFQNVLDYALVLAFTIAVGFIAYGGIRLIFSAGNDANIKIGHKIITNALIGLVIILSAWMIVNTAFWLAKSVGGQDYTGTWFRIECVE